MVIKNLKVSRDSSDEKSETTKVGLKQKKKRAVENGLRLEA